LIIPDGADLTIEVEIGQKITAGETVVARCVAKPQAAVIPNP
jgi:hypothetical protein